ncbi:DUF4276 family protein [Pantoea ananatis]|uniref:DUF4276 family protein n=1 Tax=Pantoea ananas TaxID=553 RepID=UPI0010592AF2|nr:DUF4276 family protein [Pantoea ananatis]TDL55242.1 DUF4276 family protein [Pantoea ananatis]
MKISIATEDILTEEIITKILFCKGGFEILYRLGKKGVGYLTSKLDNFNQLAQQHDVLVVFDLDLKASHDIYTQELERRIANKNRTLHIFISVREVESWILADRTGLGNYLKISKDKIDKNPDLLLDPKEKLVSLARISKNSTVRKGLAPTHGAAAKVGISYNTLLTTFIWQEWDLTRAIECSPSLKRVSESIDSLR